MTTKSITILMDDIHGTTVVMASADGQPMTREGAAYELGTVVLKSIDANFGSTEAFVAQIEGEK